MDASNIIADQPYASSPSGWVISILLAVIGTLGWYYWRKQDKITDKHTDALGLILATQAAILQRLSPLEIDTEKHSDNLRALDNQMAVVTAIQTRHETWHENREKQ